MRNVKGFGLFIILIFLLAGSTNVEKLLAGIPSGLNTTNYSNNISLYSLSRIVGEEVKLEKNKPVYLAALLGTTKNSLISVSGENGELPEGIEEVEIALLYKVLWTDRKN